MKKPTIILLFSILICTLTACQTPETAAPIETTVVSLTWTQEILPTASPTSTPEPPRVLTICSQEPASLFLYADTSSAARSILQAIYDGPFDMVDYTLFPVILEKTPSIEDGDVILLPVEVQPGELLMDASGKWVSLGEGVRYRPSGCLGSDCALEYQGTDLVQMDSLVAWFHLLPGVTWSDGTNLTASDSVYAFEIFEALYGRTPPEVLQVTRSYTALDERTVEWTGIPGYVGMVSTKFFSPLPAHLWDGFDLDTLISSELLTREPIGWGAYVIEEWVTGDHITLNRNPNYFRRDEGLPHFDHLVFRLMADGDEAIDALLAGECDLLDRTLLFEEHLPRLQAEQAAGRISISVQLGTAWELAAFGINTLKQDRFDFFNQVEVRRAVAMCIDRQKILDDLLFGFPQLMDTYVPPNHPLSNPDVNVYRYDPESAADVLETAGWLDLDGDPQTPRTAAGVPGIPEGTPFSFTYLVPADGERPQAAEIIKEGLTSCGLEVEIIVEDWEVLMKPGPDGSLFGRLFDMAQLAWSASLEPPCQLFFTDEVPGPYPEFPKGWGGGNLSGYSSLEFDEACMAAQLSIPGSEAYLQAHHQAQVIFAEDLPAIPLYQRYRLVAARPDLCNLVVDPSANSALNHIEMIDYGFACGSE